MYVRPSRHVKIRNGNAAAKVKKYQQQHTQQQLKVKEVYTAEAAYAAAAVKIKEVAALDLRLNTAIKHRLAWYGPHSATAARV